MTEPSKAVFLSYASQDAEAARRICDALRAAGVEVWFDQSELRGGDAWDQQIRRQIKDCALFIPLVSVNSDERTEGYFRLEWKLAVDRSHLMADDAAFLLPVAIDDTPDATARVPDRFRAVQWTRLPPGEAPPAFVERVSRLLSPVRQVPVAPARASGIAARSAEPPRRLAAFRRARPALLGVAALAVIAVAYFAVDRLVLAKRGANAGRTGSTAQSDSGELAAIPDKSIAVLPFLNLSEDKNNEYFSDGISEELLNLLAKVRDLRVTSRSSAFSFKGKDTGVAEIARLLNVAHLLEGSVRKFGNRVRITAKLIDARTDTELWSETYDRTLDDIFAAQDEIAVAVVKHLKVILLGEAPRAARVDAKAFALFLQARQSGRLHTAAGYERSVELYKQGLAIDPTYAEAWTSLAYDYRRQANNGMRPLDEGYKLAGEALRNALAIDPDFARAHAELGRISLDHDSDLARAGRHLEHALALDPKHPDIIGYSAILADSLGRLEKGIALNEYALVRDPVNPTLHTALGIEYSYSGKPENAIEQFRAALALSPDDISAHYHIGEALLAAGKPDKALAEMRQETLEAWRTTGVAMALHSLHRKQESDAAVATLVAKFSKSWPYNIAYVMAWRGEADRAFEFLETAVKEKDPGLSDIAVEPLFASLYRDPRWLPFLRKIGRDPEQLAKIDFRVALPE